MFGSTILDVAVGLVLIYLLLSLVSASIREWLAGLLKTRSTTLDEGLHELLGDKNLVEDLYNHPLINALYKGETYAKAKAGRTLPSYIPSRAFSAALLDMIIHGRDPHSALQAGPEARRLNVDTIRSQITRVGNVRVQRAVLSALDSAQGDLNAAQANIEHWFDSTMDRVSGWYKQRTQIWVFLIGLVVVIAADADSLSIARRLYTDPAERQAAVTMATGITAKDVQGDSVSQHAAAKLAQLGLPLVGWNRVPINGWWPTGDEWMAIGAHAWGAVIGWFITALAISLGAPFWFDTLGKIMTVRSALKPPASNTGTSSSDEKPSGGSSASASVSVSPGQLRASAAAAPPAPPPPPPDFHPQEWASGHPDGGAI